MPVRTKSKAVETPDKADKPTGLDAQPRPSREIGGRKQGLEPTRYGDWEKNGRCIDF
jgi:hypothetical protein